MCYNRSTAIQSKLLPIDTRASQSLEPIHLPSRLRDRIIRAQRRANAAKDGVVSFADDIHDRAILGTATAAVTNVSANLDERSQATRFLNANAGAKVKMHLPDVILSHKMRDFEARANAKGIIVTALGKPTDQSLQSLSVEERERLMSVMYTKLRQIASEVEAKFARTTMTLDANGIFDPSANIQRAQTLCLVDLQRHFRLDKLRDEAMREALNLPASAMTIRPMVQADTSQTASQLQLGNLAATSATDLKKRKPTRVYKLSAKDTCKSNLTSSLSHFRQPKKASIDDDQISTVTQTLMRCNGLASAASASHFMTQKGNIPSIITNSNDWNSHVVHVQHILAAGEIKSHKGSDAWNENSAEAAMDFFRVVNSADEWARRSLNIRAVGTRAIEFTRHCSERQRSDIFDHFRSNSPSVGISTNFRQRLHSQQAKWRKNADSVGVGEAGGALFEFGEDSDNKQKRNGEEYADLQNHIRKRLLAIKSRTRAAAVRFKDPSVRARHLTFPLESPTNLLASSSSTAPVLNCALASSDKNRTFSPEAADCNITLCRSASAVVSRVPFDEGTINSQTQVHCGPRVRLTTPKHKVMSENIMHGQRRRSLIGAPSLHRHFKSIGRHSEARIANRRDAKETWVWRQPPAAVPDNVVDIILRKTKKTCNNEEACDQGVESCDSDISARGTVRLSLRERNIGKFIKSKVKSNKSPTLSRQASRNISVRNVSTSQALTFQARIESIWRLVQLPFSDKLSMLERLSTLQDADAFISALELWERVVSMFDIRQRMKLALLKYEECGELRPSEWLSQAEIALVSALPWPSCTSGMNSNATHHETAMSYVDFKTSSNFAVWIQEFFGVVTLQTEKLAIELKARTGEDFKFQGHPYPKCIL
ncbi:uncharacterized protein PHALS_02445 [Plasmopara halstedii]|uniref:Uncharacterized protein n=1 Tax=Plasmopara halstedii TaxID=4781 RepID=A0A0N7L3N3_PLAHL|nr:uncharacterized protein PHALS_02445 [Plasmopara halstedii]CEG36355.1 hypothetical protein PHALS_02445 [Plasmopara halstedii]|eukprot:XP_024572724.1 hypothetical protein PHALS_02445 [Plasmopara halstedii]